MSYGDIDSDMYSIAQQAVANGYGKSENLRAQPTALSTRGQDDAVFEQRVLVFAGADVSQLHRNSRVCRVGLYRVPPGCQRGVPVAFAVPRH